MSAATTKAQLTSNLPLDSLLPQLNEDLAPPPKASVLSFEGGMQSLSDRLVQRLTETPNVTLRKGARVATLDRSNQQYEVR